MARLRGALRQGLDWRLLLFWVVGMVLPTLLAAMPIWRTLSGALDNYPLAHEVAQRFDMLAFSDLQSIVQRSSSALAGAALLALLAAAAVSPLLTAAIMAAAAEDERTPTASFAQRAIAWYGRSLRLWFVSLIPLALIGLAWLGISKGLASYSERATLESRVVLGSWLAWLGIALLALLLHTSVEAGRAELTANPESRSAFLAWLRGTRKALRQPFQTLILYLVPSALSLFVALLLAALRLHVSAESRPGFFFGALVTQLAVASIGWGRASRLFALTALFRAESRLAE